MTDQPQGPEKKIIVDEDWKSQVEAEREAAQGGTPPQPGGEQEPAQGPLPEPTLTMLMSSLYFQGTIALGLVPNPVSDQPQRNLEAARHTIGMLEMLREKTEGNRTPDETRELDAILHELRLAFVSAESA